ncbi:MAG: hypothetical protein V1850_06610 [Candidatus Bathyarchaeota archaeon]
MLDIFVPYISYPSDTNGILLSTLKRNIQYLKQQGNFPITIIDGSKNPLSEADIGVPVIWNKKERLCFAINLAIENASDTMLFIVSSSILGLGTVSNLLIEKESAEKACKRPVALIGQQAPYPTDNEYLLNNVLAAWTPNNVKNHLRSLGFLYTDEGITIAKQPLTQWDEFQNTLQESAKVFGAKLGAGFIADKDRLYDIGGADERASYEHGDYDMGLRWLSFGWPLLVSQSVRIHRLERLTSKICPETFPKYNSNNPPFGCSLKYEKSFETLVWLAAACEPVAQNPDLYRNSLKPQYQQEYDSLRKTPFFLGRKNEDVKQ